MPLSAKTKHWLLQISVSALVASLASLSHGAVAGPLDQGDYIEALLAGAIYLAGAMQKSPFDARDQHERTRTTDPK